MPLKKIIYHIMISFFVILGSIHIFVSIFVWIGGRTAIVIDVAFDYIIIAALTSLTQLVLYSRKKLDFKKLLLRICYCFFPVMGITTFFVYRNELLYWSNIWHVLVYTGVIVIIFVIVVLTILGQIKLEDEATVDLLTKAYNRRYFMKTAARMLNTCIKEDREFALIMFDLDHFKAVNDTYGHSIGDEVLKIATARARHILAGNTLIFRYGGEEFIILITDTTKEDVIKLAWRIQKNMASSPFVIEDLSITVTASFGIASKNSNALNLEALIKNSDQALYKAKSAGRNTVVYHGLDV